MSNNTEVEQENDITMVDKQPKDESKDVVTNKENNNADNKIEPMDTESKIESPITKNVKHSNNNNHNNNNNNNNNNQKQENGHKKNKKKKKKNKKIVNNKDLPPGYKRVESELKLMLLKPPIGVSAAPKHPNDLMHWIATIKGPEGTPYENGTFYLDVVFGQNYPFDPPKVTFRTRIYHCNVNNQNGEICLDVLKDNYSPALTVEKILMSIIALLQEPNPDDPLVGEIAKVLIADKEQHDKTAKEWTRRYAMKENQ